MPIKRRTKGKSKIQAWTTTKSIVVGVLYALGYRSHEIAKALGDGTSAPSIRHQIARSNLHRFSPIDGKRRMAVRVHPRSIVKASQLAAEAGIPLEVWAGRIIDFAARDGMYDSIVDGDREAYEGQ